MLRFTLRQLEHAIAIADHGSLARAAVALGVAQPSLSASLRKLEDQLGLQLFIRHHAQGVTASPQGLRFITEARSLVEHGLEFQRGTDNTGALVSGTLTIGSFFTIAPAHGPKLVAQFQAQHRLAQIRFEEGAQDHLLAGLRSGRFDLALLYDVNLPDDLRVTRLASVPPYVLLNARHPLARQPAVSLQQLAAEPLILLDILPSRTYFTRILEAHGISPRVAFASPSLELVRGMVGQGLGYSLLVTRPHGDHSYDGEALAVRPLREPVEQAVMALATVKSLRPTQLISTFETFCASFFATMYASDRFVS
jgi:DNA-binding transcriptional LysR family regulator